MKIMLTLSLLLNIAVLIAVCFGIITRAGWTQASYGAATPALSILLSVYLSILGASALLLLFRNPVLATALLLGQIIYKLTSVITAGGIKNPVMLSNLGIAIFHTVTLWIIWRSIGNPFRNS